MPAGIRSSRTSSKGQFGGSAEPIWTSHTTETDIASMQEVLLVRYRET